MKHRKYIEENTTYLIYSGKSKTVYLNEEGNAYLFCDLQKARSFVDKNKEVYIVEGIWNEKELLSYCYANGAINLLIYKEETETVFLCEKFLERKFYNHETQKNANLYLQTFNKTYRDSLLSGPLIIPANVTDNNIIYALGITKETNKKKVIFFSDLEQFNQWNSKMNHQWKPLLVDSEAIDKLISEKEAVIYTSQKVINIKNQ